MSDPKDDPKPPAPEQPADPPRRGVSRRSFLTDEVSRAGIDLARQLPGFGSLLGVALRETLAQRHGRVVRDLWQAVLGRPPRPEESAAVMEHVRKARSPEEKGDALADALWALLQTSEFEQRQSPDNTLVREFYQLALRRPPRPDEEEGALRILSEASEPVERVAALEGLFTALIRGHESILRKGPA